MTHKYIEYMRSTFLYNLPIIFKTYIKLTQKLLIQILILIHQNVQKNCLNNKLTVKK